MTCVAFELVEKDGFVIEQKKFLGTLIIYNIDESGQISVQKPLGKKQASVAGDSNVTVVCCTNPSSLYIPHCLFFSKRMFFLRRIKS